MIHGDTLRGNWNRVRGQLVSRWGELRGDDLDRFRGNVAPLMGEIQCKTGESRAAIEDYLEHLTSDGAAALGRAGEAAKQYTFWAASALWSMPGQLADSARHGLSSTQSLIRQRPVQTLAVGFAAGMVATIVAIRWLRR